MKIKALIGLAIIPLVLGGCIDTPSTTPASYSVPITSEPTTVTSVAPTTANLPNTVTFDGPPELKFSLQAIAITPDGDLIIDGILTNVSLGIFILSDIDYLLDGYQINVSRSWTSLANNETYRIQTDFPGWRRSIEAVNVKVRGWKLTATSSTVKITRTIPTITVKDLYDNYVSKHYDRNTMKITPGDYQTIDARTIADSQPHIPATINIPPVQYGTVSEIASMQAELQRLQKSELLVFYDWTGMDMAPALAQRFLDWNQSLNWGYDPLRVVVLQGGYYGWLGENYPTLSSGWVGPAI